MIDNEIKEFYVMRVKKYNKELSLQNAKITICNIIVGISAIYIIVMINTGEMFIFEPPFIYRHLAIIACFCYGTLNLVNAIANKVEIETEIEKIKKLFANRGLILEYEMSKDKGMSK